MVVGGAVVGVVVGTVVVGGGGAVVGGVVGGTVGVVPAMGVVPPVGDAPLVGDVLVFGDVVGTVVVPAAGCKVPPAGLAVTTTDHTPHLSFTFPFTWPGPASSENQ